MHDLLSSMGQREHDYIVYMCDRKNMSVCGIENVKICMCIICVWVNSCECI